MRALVLLPVGLLGAACAPMGMPMMHGPGGGSASRASGPILREVVAGGTRAVVTVPPLEAGREDTLTLSLSDADRARPFTGAEVRLRVRGAGRRDAPAETPARETGPPGTYSASFMAAAPGRVEIGFRVVVPGGRGPGSVLEVDAGVVVVAPASGAAAGHHGARHMASRVAIGGALMAAMMLAMLVARGGMRY
ncbi:MAG: hypothetical protein HZC42_07975 [Candidatus Eisenbacteria bacterium]|nr:hypothetical protein [Candidatus Eisenbacteria bacterium]